MMFKSRIQMSLENPAALGGGLLGERPGNFGAGTLFLSDTEPCANKLFRALDHHCYGC